MSFNPFSYNPIQRAERDRDGSIFYETFSSKNSNNSFKSDANKLKIVLSNPAVLKVLKLQCDMYSLGISKAISNKKELENDPLIKKLKNPNPFQTGTQFKWDYMANLMIFGAAYLYSSSKVIREDTVLYWLDPSRIIWTDKICKKLDKIVLSKESINEINKISIDYINYDGTVTKYSLGEIKPFFDLSNGFGNWYKGISAIESLYKVINNIELSLDSKASNLEFSGKFMVSGTAKHQDIHDSPMGDNEKQSVELGLSGIKKVHVLKKDININRFVEDIGELQLDESYFNSYYKIGTLFGIPRDTLEAGLTSSKFKNQEISKAIWIEQSIRPKSQDMMEGIGDYFSYSENTKLIMSYNHLSFMQIFRDQEQNANKIALENIKLAKELGFSDEQAKQNMLKIMLNE